MESNTVNYDDLVIRESNLNNSIINIKPSNNIIFSDGEDTVGEITWNDGVFKFSGKAEPSAKIFFDYVVGFLNTDNTNETTNDGR